MTRMILHRVARLVQCAEKAGTLAGLFKSKDFYYLSDSMDWTIYWEGHYLATHLKRRHGLTCAVHLSPWGIRNSLVHFGSQFMFVDKKCASIHPSNRIAVSYFHGDTDDQDPAIQECARTFPVHAKRASLVVTASSIVRERLLSWGIPNDKVVLMPLGVDLELFAPSSLEGRLEMRRRLGIPDGAICIGSFQKDGVGWGEGHLPKLVKGPDIFLSVVQRIATKCSVCVLLTGPARGYVKEGLRKMGIPYRHVYIRSYKEFAACYHALDLYVVASREEGGPKAILECMATGVPLVSARVGMAPDVILDGKNGFVVPVGDVDALVKHSLEVIFELGLRESLVRAALVTAREYEWERIADRYFEAVYQRLLSGRLR